MVSFQFWRSIKMWNICCHWKHLLLVSLLLYLCCVPHSTCKQYSLNVPRVLLPFVPSSPSGVKVNFTLTSPQGCFTWSSTKPDIASVEPLYDSNEKDDLGCSNQALLTAQSSQQTRLSTIIIAEEQVTGVTLRCDVFVDTISRIEITTRTRELLLEEEPERFELQAFDDEGNMFSTVRGHKFQWSLHPDEEATHQQPEPEAILNFIPFEESTYSTDPIIGELENRGLQGDIVLVAGVNTGTAKVQVKITDPVWKSVKPDVVKLLVVENLMLQPSMDVYILPLSFVDYRVERRKHGKIEIVSMPSDQYMLEVTNTTVGRLERRKSRVTGLVVGFTEVVLQDKNMLHTPSALKPTAGIHVVPPHHLGFTITPGNNWVLEVGREYTITVHIFDKMNHKILVTENVPLKTILPAEYLQSFFSSINGSHHHVKTLQRGTTSLHSSLTAMKHADSGELHDLPVAVSKQQSLEIYDPVKLEPECLVLVWDPHSEYRYKYAMKASGGSGNYQWSCDPENIVGVSTTGTLTPIARGKTLVVAADKKNTAHFAQSKVHVVPPADMSFLPSRVEAVVGSHLLLPVQVRGYTIIDEGEHPDQRVLLAFPDCRGLKLNVESTDHSIFNISMETEATPTEGACLMMKVSAVKPGHTRITLSYKYDDVYLEAMVTIAAYPPLVAMDPETIAIVTLGSSKNFVFEGGPAPWVLDRSKFYERLSAERVSDLSIYQQASVQVGGHHHVYRVVCKQLGEQTLEVVVGNGKTLKNHFPASEKTSARISCALPVSMVIRPVLKQMLDCPLFTESASQNVQFPVRSDRHLDLEVVLYDAESRPFDNFTSLHWRWGSSNENLLPTPSSASLVHHDLGAILSVRFRNQQSGSVVITATSDRHTPRYLTAENIVFKDPFSPGVNHSLSLLLRSEPRLSPSYLLLFNHPDNKGTINILHGSGHFRVDHMTKTRPPASMHYSAKSHDIVLTPFSDGEMKLTVVDLCLEVDRPITATVMVAGIASIEVKVADKVQLGNSTLAFVKVLDSRQSPFPADQLRHMNLLANPKTAHIRVSPATDDLLSSLNSDLTSHSAVFVVHGVAVGTTHLLFNATSTGGKIVSSWPQEIQVFDALKLLPKYITLLPTATFEIRSSGGPKPQATILYSISNVTVATVDDGGIIEASVPGVAIVTGKAQSVDPVTGRTVTYSQDVVYVTVVKLTGVKIFVPSTRLLAGVEVGVHALGLNDETPFAFGSATPGLSFHWSSSNMDVMSLASIYDKAGVSIQEEQDFSALLRTRHPGQAIVRLTAVCHPGACEPEEATFNDHIQIQVISRLELLRPSNGHFLLPYSGLAQIVTNRDGISPLSYHLLQENTAVEKRGLVSLSPHGEIQAAAVSGHAVVMVICHEEDVGLNQTVMVHVEVGPVSALSIVPLSLAQAMPNSKYHAFPLGYSAEFIVHLHDNIGRTFDYAEIDLSYRLSRYDIIRISPETGNATYTVKAAREGDVILKVYVTTLAHIANYVRVRVGYAILPSLATVHLGSSVCFTTHLTEDKPGWWSAGEEDIVQLQPGTGVGVAHSTGTTVIYHNIEDVIDTHTEITVSKIDQVLFNVSSTLPMFTNAERSELNDYHIPVRFVHGKDEDFSLLQVSPNPGCFEEFNLTSEDSPVFIQQVLFECLLELKDRSRNLLPAAKFISSEPYFDSRTGMSYCSLDGTNDLTASEMLSSMDGLSLSLTVRARDYSDTYEVFSTTMSVPFIPAFALSRSKIILSVRESSVQVDVSGLPRQLQALKVVSPFPISVIKLSDSGSKATYRVSIISDSHTPEPFNDLTVTFSSPLAHQESILFVSYIIEPSVTIPAPPPTAQTQTKTPPRVAKQPKLPTQQRPKVFTSVDDDTSNYFIIIFTIVVVVIATIVVCLAVRQGAGKSRGGFTAHLPHTPQQAFSPVATPVSQNVPGFQTPNLNQRTPPIPGQSGGQSAFQRTRLSGSPHGQGLFTQH